MNDVQSSDLEDPLQDYTDLALFRNSFKFLPDVSKPDDIDHQLQVIHTRIKSMELENPAKKYLSGTYEVPKFDNPKANEQKIEVISENAEENPRQRRQGLGRKRARFSMKPNLSQPAMSLLQTFDVKIYKDPEEMWKAYDRNELAKKEIKKHMGDDQLGANQHNPSPIKRSHRPGLLGRSVQYKHLYPSIDSETSENGRSSQKTIETSIPSPMNHSSQIEPVENVALEEMDLAASIAKEDNNLKDILYKILSKDSEAPEGDEMVNLAEELSLPEFQNVRKFDFKSSRRASTKPMNVLKDIDNLLKGISSRTPAKRIQGAEGSINLASPTPPKSPFASILALNKKILQSNPSSDPFSADDIDWLPVTNTCSVENDNEQSELVDMGGQSTNYDKLKLPLIEQTNNTEIALTGSPEVVSEKLSHEFERSMGEYSSKLGACTDVGSSRSHIDMEDNVGDRNMDDRILDGTLSRPSADTDAKEHGDKADDIDRLPVTNTSSVENDNEQSELVDIGGQSTNYDKLKSPLIEQTDNTENAQTGSLEVVIEKLSHEFERSMGEYSSKLGACTEIGSGRSHIDMEDNIGDLNMDNRILDGTLSRPSADTDAKEHGDKVEDKLEEAVASADPEINVAHLTLENSNSSQTELGQLHSTEVEDHPTDGLSRNIDTDPERHNEIMLEQSDVSLNQEINTNSHLRRKRKMKRVSESPSLAAVEEHPTDGLSRNLETGPEMPNEIMQEQSEVSLNKGIKGNLHPSRKQKIKHVSESPSLAAVEEHPTDGLSTNLETGPEMQNEITQEHPILSQNQQIKANSRPHRKQKSKEVSKTQRRQSLAGAGTKWQSGVRRSTRIKTRPLEYWKGERLLYGRIHETMTTVIGIKYASPGKGSGNAPLKVKSFVSDDYKELVELAGLH